MDNRNIIKEKIKVLKRMKRDETTLLNIIKKQITEYEINVEYKFKNYNDYDKDYFTSLKLRKKELINKIEKIENIIKELENE